MVIRQQALEAVPELIRRLKPYAENDFDALEALRSLETMAMAAPDGAVPDGAAAPGQPQQEKELRSGVSLRRQVLRREMELAWKLLEANELTQDEYAQLVDDLSRLIANERQAIISLLHVLTDRSFPGLERILRYVSKASKTPFIALGSFEVQKVDLGSVPLEYLLQQGVLPFETMGNELLVALLNPSTPRYGARLAPFRPPLPLLPGDRRGLRRRHRQADAARQARGTRCTRLIPPMNIIHPACV